MKFKVRDTVEVVDDTLSSYLLIGVVQNIYPELGKIQVNYPRTNHESEVLYDWQVNKTNVVIK